MPTDIKADQIYVGKADVGVIDGAHKFTRQDIGRIKDPEIAREAARAVNDANDGDPKAINAELDAIKYKPGKIDSLHLLAARNSREKSIALTDSLTGLGNRRRFDEEFDQQLSRENRISEPFGVILGDLRGLKPINDSYGGHAAGDEVLRRVSAILTETLRKEDTKYRIGGDEFAALVDEFRSNPKLSVKDELCMAAIRTSRAIDRDKIDLKGKDYYPHMDLGATIVKEHDNKKDVLQRTDNATYLCKIIKKMHPDIQGDIVIVSVDDHNQEIYEFAYLREDGKILYNKIEDYRIYLKDKPS
jgi:diguanylate cyclase (GGDEF)-like protein